MRRMSKKTQAEIDRLIEDGAKAAREGKTKEDCPYEYDLMRRVAWFWGFLDTGNKIRAAWATANAAPTPPQGEEA